ncbi:hypothetical protein GO495_30270 [Chitinophaga oryziterrae]|uniref:Uncharacterized protein n=1 Tax=Chitinophaga oryziterrae TaxID=1031224 RepID=A0A6N8JKK6_9BACT|nr:hypothetical protein [Chitinophaga oryziterrae]MVT44916.1 hypothetical protein [Chitinophaga oryziterrae]
MKHIILFIFLITFFGTSGHGQNWTPCKGEGPVLKKAMYYKDSVIMLYKTMLKDTTTYDTFHLERKLYLTVTRTYHRNGLVTIDTTISAGLNYMSKNTVSIWDTITFKLPKPGSPKDSVRILNSLPIDNRTSSSITDSSHVTHRGTSDTVPLTRKALRTLYENGYYATARPPAFYAALSFIPSMAYRMILVNDPQFNKNDLLEKRKLQEKPIFEFAASLAAGIFIKKKHTLYAEYLYIREGFKANQSAVDWASGLPQTTTGKNTYTFYSHGIGVGYICGGYLRSNFITDIGVYLTWRNTYQQNHTKDLYDEALRDHACIAKIGIGYNIRLGTTLSLKILPVIYYNLSPVNSETLKTRLYNIGLSTGISFHNVKNKIRYK